MAAELTLGAEEELHLIDLATSKLSARAPQLLSRLPPQNYAAEIQRTTVETKTEVVDSLAGLREELVRLRRGIVDVATGESIGIAAVGTAPMSAFPDFELTATGRYGRMQEQYRLLVDEQLIWVVRPDGSDARRIAGSSSEHAELGPWTRSGHRAVVTIPAERADDKTVSYLADPATGELTALASGDLISVLDLSVDQEYVIIRDGQRGRQFCVVLDRRADQDYPLLPHPVTGSTER